MRIGRFCAACLFSLAPAASGAVLVSDSFDDVAAGAGLSGRAPDGVNYANNVNANAWVSTTTRISGTGTGALSANPVNGPVPRTNAIDLGAGFFAATPGVYTITFDMGTASGNTGLGWAGFGLTPAADPNVNIATNSGGPWALIRLSGAAVVFPGPGASGGVSSTLTAGPLHTYRLLLDTSAAQWTFDATIDDTPVDLNGGAAGNTYTYATNPTTLRYLTIGQSDNGTSTGTLTLDNLALTGPTPAPEPGTAGLLAAAAVGVLSRRRRA